MLASAGPSGDLMAIPLIWLVDDVVKGEFNHAGGNMH